MLLQVALKDEKLTYMYKENLRRWKWILEEIGEMSRLEKNINNVIRKKMNVKNLMLEYISILKNIMFLHRWEDFS